MYVCDFYTGNTYSHINDVWKSSDSGISWTISTTSASFSPRRGAKATAFLSTIYLIGGVITDLNGQIIGTLIVYQ